MFLDIIKKEINFGIKKTHLKTYFCIFEVKGKAFEGIIIRNSNMRAGGCKLERLNFTQANKKYI